MPVLNFYLFLLYLQTFNDKKHENVTFLQQKSSYLIHIFNHFDIINIFIVFIDNRKLLLPTLRNVCTYLVGDFTGIAPG